MAQYANLPHHQHDAVASSSSPMGINSDADHRAYAHTQTHPQASSSSSSPSSSSLAVASAAASAADKLSSKRTASGTQRPYSASPIPPMSAPDSSTPPQPRLSRQHSPSHSRMSVDATDPESTATTDTTAAATNLAASSSASSLPETNAARSIPANGPHSPSPHKRSKSNTAQTEREAVLQDVSHQKRKSHRRRASASSQSSQVDHDEDDRARSRTPSPILGDYSYAGAASRLGHAGAPMVGPSAADIQSLLYEKSESRLASRPSVAGLGDVAAIISKVEEMGFKDQAVEGQATAAEAPASDALSSSQPPRTQSREEELAQMVKKLGQHAIEQDAYISRTEESLHDLRVTAVSVVSSLTATHAYELAQEKQLRDRLEVELEGAQASARMLSSLLAKSQNKRQEMDKERAASVEEEMRWVASLPGSFNRKPSASAVAAAAAAMSPRSGAPTSWNAQHPRQTPVSPSPQNAEAEQSKTLQAGPSASTSAAGAPVPATTPTTAAKTEDVTGLGILHTPTMQQQPDYADVFDSPMSAVISDRNKLIADKRYLRNRVRDAEAQLHRLENELKALRPLLVQGGAKSWFGTGSAGPSVPVTPSSHHQTPSGKSGRRDRSRRRRPTTMGDAEAEHLLLAARRLNHARSQAGSVPPNAELMSSPSRSAAYYAGDRPRTPPPGRAGGALPRTPGTSTTVGAKTPRSLAGKMRANGVITGETFTPGKVPLNGTSPVTVTAAGSPQSKSRPSFALHSRTDSNMSNASFTGMDELLHAAQSVLTPRDRMQQEEQQRLRQQQLLQQQQHQQQPPQHYLPRAGRTVTGTPLQGTEPGYFARAETDVFGTPSKGLPLAPISTRLDEVQDSPKRRRVSQSAAEHDKMHMMSVSPHQRYTNSPGMSNSRSTAGAFQSSGVRRNRTRTEGADVGLASPMSAHPDERARAESGGPPLSALDLLADQAAISQNPSQSSETSNSDGERRNDGFSSQEESGPAPYSASSVEDRRRSSYVAGSGLTPKQQQSLPPRTAASSLMAARARVSAAAPLAYTQHSDSAMPRYTYGGSQGGGATAAGSSPNPALMGSASTAGAPVPPHADPYAPRGVGSMGHLGAPYGGSLPPIGPHHPHGSPSSHLSSSGGAGIPPSPHYSQHGHHHSLPSLSTAIAPPVPGSMVGPNGYSHGHSHSHSHMGSSPISASSPTSTPSKHHHPQQPHPYSHRPSLSLDGSSMVSIPSNGSSSGGGMMSPMSAATAGGCGGGYGHHRRESSSGMSNIAMGMGPGHGPGPGPGPGMGMGMGMGVGMRPSISSTSTSSIGGGGGSGAGSVSGNGNPNAAPKAKGGNTSPDKRLPYVRWTSEEDSKLKQAIAQHGQRWEAVAKAVGTRSYHQCRQRALLMRRKGMDPGAGGDTGGSGGGGEGGSGNGPPSSGDGEEGDEGEEEGDEDFQGEGDVDEGDVEGGQEMANVPRSGSVGGASTSSASSSAAAAAVARGGSRGRVRRSQSDHNRNTRSRSSRSADVDVDVNDTNTDSKVVAPVSGKGNVVTDVDGVVAAARTDADVDVDVDADETIQPAPR